MKEPRTGEKDYLSWNGDVSYRLEWCIAGIETPQVSKLLAILAERLMFSMS